MTVADTPIVRRKFEPGTLGWSAADLDDPEFRRFWDEGHYEIVEGVLAIMPPALFAGGEALSNLGFMIRTYLKERGLKARFAGEAELVISDTRVYRSDLALVTETDEKQIQSLGNKASKDWRFRPLKLPPSLIIESISRGHESHDKIYKRRAYAEFGVANYWLLDAFSKTLECLVLEGSEYRTELQGKDDDLLQSPRLFPGLVIKLADIWGQ